MNMRQVVPTWLRLLILLAVGFGLVKILSNKKPLSSFELATLLGAFVTFSLLLWIDQLKRWRCASVLWLVPCITVSGQAVTAWFSGRGTAETVFLAACAAGFGIIALSSIVAAIRRG